MTPAVYDTTTAATNFDPAPMLKSWELWSTISSTVVSLLHLSLKWLADTCHHQLAADLLYHQTWLVVIASSFAINWVGDGI